MNRYPHSTLLAVLLTAPLATASTWVVDANGGPGVDFTDIGAAEAASLPGDVILVMPGSYPGFTVDVAVSILGQTGGLVHTGDVLVNNVPAGDRMTLAGVATGKIKIINCAARVTLEDLVAEPTFPTQMYGSVIDIRSSPDVRLRNVRASSPSQGTIHALSVTTARVEVTHSVLEGSRGHSYDLYHFFSNPEDGGDGIRVFGASGSVHVSSSEVRGGAGGDLPDNLGCGSCVSGDGGAGIRILAGHALLTGPSGAVVIGGAQGVGNSCDEDGIPGTGIAVAAAASLVWSGAHIESGPLYYPCIPVPPAITGPNAQMIPDDPTLTLSGTALPGHTVMFTVAGQPGAQAILNVGRQLTVTDVPNAEEDQLTFPLRNFSLGTLPASGQATYSFLLPSASPKGSILIWQGRTTDAGGNLALTQSLPITLR